MEGSVPIAGDCTVVVGCLDVVIERAGSRHVREVRPTGRVACPRLRQHHDLGELSPRDLLARPEAAVAITGDDPVVVGCFYVAVEGMVARDIQEVRPSRCIELPSCCQHHDLGQLAASCARIGPERIVGVARDNVPAGKFHNRSVEVVVRGHVAEVAPAAVVSRRGSRDRRAGS